MRRLDPLWEKQPVLFSVFWILLYVAVTSAADAVSIEIGAPKALTVVWLAALSALMLLWILKNGKARLFGLCPPETGRRDMLYYLPLAALISVNLWFGVKMNMPAGETVCYVLSMLLVGFAEEIIFRGFLFRAMEKDGRKAAVIVSSVTFGIGHMVNLINGSGAQLLPNLLQVCYAVAAGYLFVTIFLKTQSLYPAIVTHSAVNALSAFSRGDNMGNGALIVSALALFVLSAAYAYYLKPRWAWKE